MLASEIERLGFKTTVINPEWDPEKDERGLPGLEALKKADLAIFYTRFLKIDNQQLIHITEYLKSGKPVVVFGRARTGLIIRMNIPIKSGTMGLAGMLLVHPTSFILVVPLD